MKSTGNTKTSNPLRTTHFRRSALASACALALGTLAAGGAQAQNANYTVDLTSAINIPVLPAASINPAFSNGIYTASYYILNNQADQGALTSKITNVFVGTQYQAGVATGTSVTVGPNSTKVTTIGNLVDPNFIDVTSISNEQPFIMSSQIQAAPVPGNTLAATSLQSNVKFGVSQTSGVAADVTVTGNTMNASTTLNMATSQLAGSLTKDYSSAQAGSITATTTATKVTTSTEASMGIATHQEAYNAGGKAGSFANIDGSVGTNSISLNLQGITSPFTEPLTLSDNGVSAAYTANTATSGVNISATSPFQGTIGFTNVQANIENVGNGALPTANVVATTIGANITSGTATPTVLDSNLSVNGNSLSATSTGNAAGTSTPTGITAGNSITLTGATNFTGNATTTTNSLSNTASAASATLGADLALVNEQGNRGTYLNSQVTGTAGLTNGIVTARVDQVGTGTVTADSNSVAAGSTGNLAGNLVMINGSNLTGSLAAASSQRNDSTAIGATVTAGSVTVNVGTIAATAISGPITATNNDISAVVDGNVAATTVKAVDTNLTSVAEPAGASTTSASTVGLGVGSTTATGGVTAANLQGNYGGSGTTIGSTVTGSFVAVNIADQFVGGSPQTLRNVNGASITVDGNNLTSDAAGSTGNTNVTLSGTNATLQAGVANAQLNTNTVSGQVLQSGVTANMASATAAAAGGNKVNVTNNTIASTATANDGTNTLSANFKNPTMGTDPVTSAVTVTATDAGSNAALAVSSVQSNTGPVVSLTQNTLAGGLGGSFAGVYFGAAGAANTNSNLTVSDNHVTADTMGNLVTNKISLTSTNLDTAANAATSVAGLANLQTNNITGVANGTVDGGAPAVLGVGITFNTGAGSTLSGSKLSVDDNVMAATSFGNQATNGITAKTADFSSAAPLAASGAIDPAAGTASNEFALVNVQTDAASLGRTAQVINTALGISNQSTAAITTSISGSNLTVSGNQMTAEGRNNLAGNSISLTDSGTLSSGASLLNSQSSSTAVSANVSEDRVRIRAAGANTITDSNLTISENKLLATAVGSSAGNLVSVAAGNLSGNANLTASGSGVSGAGVVTADYGIANNQSQTTGAVSSLISTPVRIINSTAGSVVSGGSLTVAKNTLAAVSQATIADNTLTLTAPSTVGNSVTGVTGAIGSTQNTTSAVSSIVRPEVGGPDVLAITVGNLTNVATSLSQNIVQAASGQNKATNSETVSGGNITGKALQTQADFSVVNSQTGTGAVTALATVGNLDVYVNNTVTGGSIAVSENNVSALSNVNDSGNSLALAALSGVTGTGTVVNTQTANAGLVSSTINGIAAYGGGVSVGVVAPLGVNTTTLDGTSIAVSKNILDAEAARNTTTNDLSVSGANITGGAASSGGFTQSFSTISTQDATTAGDTTSSVVVGVIGTPVTSAVNGTKIGVADNIVNAITTVNTATNHETLSALSTLSGSGVVSNTQTSAGAGLVTATISAGTNGSTVGTTLDSAGNSAFTGGSVSVADNHLIAQAGRNMGTNTLQADGATVTGDAAMAPASFTVVSNQTGTGGVSASATVTSIGASATTANGTSFSVADNIVGAVSNSNTVHNTLGSTVVASLTGTERIDNTQTSSGGTVAATVTTTRVGLQGSGVSTLINTPVTVSGNLLSADASRNVGTNALNISGVNTVAGSAPAVGTPASFSIGSLQNGNGDVTATNNLGLLGVTTNDASAGVTFGVVDNTVLASANVNIIRNTLNVGSVNTLSGTAQIGNVQNSGTSAATAVSASVTGTSGVAPAQVGVTPTVALGSVLNGVPATVSGNVLSAQGGGNTAVNSLEASAVNTIGGSAFPTYAVLNSQNNAASVTTNVSFATIGVSAATLTNSVVSVSGNQASAVSYGNSASNSLSISAGTASNLASALVSNAQVNTAAISSTVTGVNIGVSGTVNTSGGSAVVGSNSVNALSVGNSASNVILSK